MDAPSWGPGGPPEKINVFRKTYRKLNQVELDYLDALKDKAQELYDLIDTGGPTHQAPQSREKSLAKTNLEQAIMWAVKDVTR
jgi:hypothetical protein